MNSRAPEATPNIREVWQLVRVHAKKDLRRVAVALVPPHAPGVRAYFADGSQRDYRCVGGLLEDVPGGFESWPPPPYANVREETCEAPTVYELKVTS